MKLKSIKNLNPEKIQDPDQIKGGRGSRYWDTSVNDGDGNAHRDHLCPNGNLLIEQ